MVVGKTSVAREPCRLAHQPFAFLCSLKVRHNLFRRGDATGDAAFRRYFGAEKHSGTDQDKSQSYVINHPQLQ